MILYASARLMKQWLWDTQARMVLGVAFSLLLGWLSVKGMNLGLVAYQFHEFPVMWALAFNYAVVMHAALLLTPIVIGIVVFASIVLRPLVQCGTRGPLEDEKTLSVVGSRRGPG